MWQKAYSSCIVLTALVKHGCSTYMEFNIKIIGEELAAKLLVNGIFQYIGEKKHIQGLC